MLIEHDLSLNFSLHTKSLLFGRNALGYPGVLTRYSAGIHLMAVKIKIKNTKYLLPV